MKKLILIIVVLFALDIQAQTTPNLPVNVTLTKDTVFSYKMLANYSWFYRFEIKNPHAVKTASVDIVTSTDGVRWSLYSSTMTKLVSAMSSKISGTDTTWYQDFSDFYWASNYFGLRVTKNGTTGGTMNGTLVLKQNFR